MNGLNTDKREADNRRAKTPAVSRVLDDGVIVDLVYNPTTHSTGFAVCRDDTWSFEQSFATSGEELIPFSPNNNLIKNRVVLLPSEPCDYVHEEVLLAEVQAFIRRYADLTQAFERIATHYVILTWLYDAFNELPYLRLRGDFGTGKTRTLLTLGSICYKPFFASGASTVSPIFHTLDAFRGTLIFDEADFRFTDERAELVKILNNGNVKGMPVLRTMMNRQKEFDPRAFQVFGPKIVATRGRYDDKALESRFLTEEMGGRPLRADVPINLPDCFDDEAQELRNKLLLYRFHRRHEVKINPSLADSELEPRLNQILLPLLSIVRDPTLQSKLRVLAKETQAGLVADRSLLVEAQVLEVLAELVASTERPVVALTDITLLFRERYGLEYDKLITNRWIGGILRRKFNLKTYKSHGVFVLPMTERSKIEMLCTRYGIDLNVDDVQLGDVGTSGTS